MANAEQWAARINEAHVRLRDNIFEVGRLLLEAKQELGHGKFGIMVKRDLPFGQRHADRLMKIAKKPQLTNSTNRSILPACISTLHELARIDDKTLDDLFQMNVVSPAMMQKDVAKAKLKQQVEADAKRVARLAPVRGRFRTIVLDPPWESGGGRGLPYASMSQDELEDPKLLPMCNWLHEDEAHVYLWTTNSEMPNALRLLELWDVEFQCILVWKKPSFSMGFYFRHQAEFVLFGTRGKLRTRPAARSISTVFEGGSTTRAHSEKPDEFYKLVREASYGPFGEVFGRAARPGFTNLFAARQPRESELDVRIETPLVPPVSAPRVRLSL